MGQLRLSQNTIGMNQILLRKYPPAPLKTKIYREPMGFDTETLDGYCRLITASDGSSLETAAIGPIFDYLTKRAYRTTHNFFFNLRYDTQAVIKYLPRAALEQLYKTKKTTFEDFHLFYIPEKMFKITKSRHVYTFYDVAQYFEGSLEVNAQRYLGQGKSLDGLDRAKIGTSASYWKKHRKAIIKYCIQDSILTQGLARILNDTVTQDIGIFPRKYTSKARISKDYFRTYCPFPDIKYQPPWALSLAMASYSGGRFEVIKKGHFPNVWGIDICSAYPLQIANLPDLRSGKWVKVRGLSPRAVLGFYLCKIYCPPALMGPLPVRIGQDTIIYPCGEWFGYLTKAEYECYSRDLDIKVIRGCEYYDPEPTYPFKTHIEHLYELKSQTPKDNFRYDLTKIIMNSLYGAFYEKIKSGQGYYAGMLFNPIYASLITAGTRCQLWDILRKYPKDTIGTATDGILLTRDPGIEKSKVLGSWSLDDQGETTVIRSGIYRIAGKTKNRGLSKVSHLKTPYGQYPDLFAYILSNPNLRTYPITVSRPLNLGECLVHTKTKRPDMINVWTEYTYEIDINRDKKRIWTGEFSTGADLFNTSLDSMPILLGAQ